MASKRDKKKKGNFIEKIVWLFFEYSLGFRVILQPGRLFSRIVAWNIYSAHYFRIIILLKLSYISIRRRLVR